MQQDKSVLRIVESLDVLPNSNIPLTAISPTLANTLGDASEIGHASELPTNEDEANTLHYALPPADGGRDAWLVLASAFILEALVWGFPIGFGVFQEYYSTNPQFQHSASTIAAIGTSATGIMYIAAPPVYIFLRKFPHWRKRCSILGFIVLLGGLIGASFANTIPQLLAFQGVVYAVGGSFHYYPVFLYLDEWFVARKGMAYGVVWAGGATTGVAIPLVMRWILTHYGFRTALRIWAVVCVVFTVPALFFMKGRLPDHHASTGPQKIEFGFLKSKAFLVLELGNVLQSLGYYMPGLYLPSFAKSVGLTPLTGTIALSLMAASNIAGAILIGSMTDRYHVTTAINTCATGTLVAVFLFWSFAVSTPMLFVFAILYGIFAGGFASTWSGAVDPIRKSFPAVETGLVVCFFVAGKGVSSLVSGPVSGALVRSDAWRDHAGFAFGSGYGYLIVFSGVTASLSFVGWVGKRCGLV